MCTSLVAYIKCLLTTNDFGIAAAGCATLGLPEEDALSEQRDVIKLDHVWRTSLFLNFAIIINIIIITT